jgi:hypothetical protein
LNAGIACESSGHSASTIGNKSNQTSRKSLTGCMTTRLEIVMCWTPVNDERHQALDRESQP